MMREKNFLRCRYAGILASFGVVLLMAGGLTLVPLAILPFYPHEACDAAAFLLPAAIQAVLGYALWRKFRQPDGTLTIAEGGVVVTLSWMVVVLFAAYPFMHITGLNFSAAVFESVSGWSSTGITVVDVASASRMILFWRSFLQYMGGAGLAIMMMSAIFGVTGVGISSAEGRGDQLLPQVHRSARLVLLIYVCYALIGTLAYGLAGMPWFDAINHALTAIATGGFSTIPQNFSAWNSITIEGITIVLMLFGNLSFVTAWYLFRGRFRIFWKNAEVRVCMVLLPVSILLMTILTFQPLYHSFGQGLRTAMFEAVSLSTTTGFSKISYSDWNSFSYGMTILLMFIGGGSCSTAGGLKQIRVFMLFKILGREILRIVRPKTQILESSFQVSDHPVYLNPDTTRNCAATFFLYVLTVFSGTMLICACGFSFDQSLFEVVSAISGTGYMSGITTPDMPKLAIWTLSAVMVLGRLEVLIVLATCAKVWQDLRHLCAGSA